MSHPIDNLVRARYDDGAATLRAADEGTSGRTLFGHFAVFDRFTEIDSWYEGRFMERVGDKAFTRTFKERGDKIRVLYDHGHDPSIGNKPLGAPDVLRVDKGVGPYYESELFESNYVEELIPALRAGQLGASFRFKVTGEQWVEPKKATDANPERLKERTITEVELYEFGPVTFPAYADATAGVRSTGTDTFIESLMDDPRFVARFTERAGLSVVEKILASLPDDVRRKASASNESTDGDTETASRTSALLAVERARMTLLAQPTRKVNP
jgi:HK97 family phage prohead protease